MHLFYFLERIGGPKTFKIKFTIKEDTVNSYIPDIYGKLNADFRSEGVYFHTYQLPQDRCPMVV